ncbi:DMT family transporter [Inmirania thermothiophila]|uniref:DME family drug/metabolite transporter n=1 Tax=Inmirania thermothiophila TaxID=1750597 RepID=A0A3N1XSY3_9GAMM|nr:DMT family transporter [Inmirania thermothiophila]ROR29749.1 DME family drug/metabolite transporter [Inmirania thermothiophila]
MVTAAGAFKSPAVRGYALMVAAAALWGLIGPVSRVAFAEGMAPLEVAFWRALLAWGLFALQGGRRVLAVRPGELAPLAAFGVVGVAVFYGAYQLAVRDGGAALASVLLYTAPAWVALLAWWLLGEGLGAAKLAALALTLAGVVGVAADGGSLTGGARILPALFWGLVSGLAYALYYILGKRWLAHHPTPVLLAWALPAGALGLAPFVGAAPPSARAWGAVAFLAVGSTWLAYSLYYAGLRRLEASRAALVATLEPVVAALVAWLWWGERFGAAGWLGAALIFAGVVTAVAAPAQAR